MKIYHFKLVRDNIPSIIEEDNKYAYARVLEDEEYIEKLTDKLIEESEEVKDCFDKEDMLEELADVLEVVDAISEFYQISKEDLLKFKEQKANKNGKYSERYYLEYVNED